MAGSRAAIRWTLTGAAFLLLFLLGCRSLVRGPDAPASQPVSWPPLKSAWTLPAEPPAPQQAAPGQPASRPGRADALALQPTPVADIGPRTDHNGHPLTAATWAEAAFATPPPREAFG